MSVLNVTLLLGLYVGAARLKSRWGVRSLQAKRLRIERL
jgi:hypothetical protein